jgi:parallel beta-helix repeat protein
MENIDKIWRLLCFLGVGLALAVWPYGASVAGPYVVNVSYDGPDSNLADGICYDGVAGCTLRAAIQQAAADGVATVITFHSSLANTTLLLSPAYGTIIWAGSNITVSGESHNISISGQILNPGQSAFQIQGNNNLLRNLTIRNAPQDGIQVGDFAGVGAGNNNQIRDIALLGNGAAGVYVHGSPGSGGQNNIIRSGTIGTAHFTATTCVPGEGNGGNGVYIDASAGNTLITFSYIVCNGENGIFISGAGGAPSNTQVNINNIGTTNSTDMGNGQAGIRDDQAIGTQIYGNTISGNDWSGVWLNGSTNALLTANRIGTDDNGLAALPNGHDGVAVTDGAGHNRIGLSTDSSNRNIISGNTWCGVRLRDGAHENTVDINYLGLNAAGTSALPNGEAGIAVLSNSNDNTIGTSSPGVAQFISGNTREGIYIENSHGNFIGQVNCIGVAANGATPLGNGLQGVMLNGAPSNGVQAGLIAYNQGAGVAVVGDTATGNKIFPFAIRNNGGLPIDLGNDGHTPNDSRTPPGPNNWLNFPVITSANGSTINGTACPDCQVFILRAYGNPAAPGGGGTYETTATVDGFGNWTATLTGGLTALDVSLAACQSPCSLISGNTSEMSPHRQLFLPLIQR